MQRWRLELFFKSQAELHGLIPFLKAQGISRVNIPNKAPEDGLLEAVTALQQQGITDICVHYSIKNQCKGRTTVKAGAAHLADFMSSCTSHQPSTTRKAQVSVLIVTGSGKKRSYNTVSGIKELDHLIAAPGHHAVLDLYVAFNPYLEGEALVEEYARLKEKLSSRLVAGVYLQVGTDLQKLQLGLEFLSCARDEAVQSSGSDAPFQVLGSVLVPSKRLLAQMRFRPWNGVFLSEEYLSGVAAAEAITRQLLEVYACHGIVPLVESSVKTQAELAHVLQLLGAQNASDAQ